MIVAAGGVLALPNWEDGRVITGHALMRSEPPHDSALVLRLTARFKPFDLISVNLLITLAQSDSSRLELS